MEEISSDELKGIVKLECQTYPGNLEVSALQISINHNSSETTSNAKPRVSDIDHANSLTTVQIDGAPLKNVNELYNNDKNRTRSKSQEWLQTSTCSKRIPFKLPPKPSMMVVHILSVGFVLAVAFVMKTGTSLFSWHPFFMSLGVVFFIAQAILVFSPSSSLVAAKPRAYKVKTHWILHLCGVTSVIIGAVIIYVNKERAGKPHAKTWHGFLGYTSVFQFCSHCIAGLFVMYPAYLKSFFTLAQLKQLHATIGLLGFFLAAGVVILGLFSDAFTKVVAHDVGWFAFASVPFILAMAIGNQVTTAYGPKKVKTEKNTLK